MLQPNYIPWKGVFDLIDRVDAFVFYDDVQYTKRDWRNRNKIKTRGGDIWLTVPVKNEGTQMICDVSIDTTQKWQENHYQTIKNNYLRAAYFKDYEYLLEEIYLKNQWSKISDLNVFSTKLIAQALGIQTEWVLASELKVSGSKDGGKVIEICKKLGCDYFINGPASKAFMNEELFQANDIRLEYMEYRYEEYQQLYKPFSHAVSVLDVLFNCGPEAKRYVCRSGLDQ